jgi:predicted nucleic acid-binding Zn ribbon protein
MPRYDLKCPLCGTVVEVECPYSASCCAAYGCGSDKPLERIYSAPPAPHFKGSGFYQTDYKGKK